MAQVELDLTRIDLSGDWPGYNWFSRNGPKWNVPKKREQQSRAAEQQSRAEQSRTEQQSRAEQGSRERGERKREKDEETEGKKGNAGGHAVDLMEVSDMCMPDNEDSRRWVTDMKYFEKNTWEELDPREGV